MCACEEIVFLDFRLENLISLHILEEVLPKFSLTPSSSAATLNARPFNPRIYVRRLGGPDPAVPLGAIIVHPFLQDPTQVRDLMA